MRYEQMTHLPDSVKNIGEQGPRRLQFAVARSALRSSRY